MKIKSQKQKEREKKRISSFLLLIMLGLAVAFVVSLLTVSNAHIVVVKYGDHAEGAAEGNDIFNYFPIQVHTNDDNLDKSSSNSTNSSGSGSGSSGSSSSGSSSTSSSSSSTSTSTSTSTSSTSTSSTSTSTSSTSTSSTSTSNSLTSSKDLLPALFKNTNGDNWDVITFPMNLEFTEEEKNVRWANFTSVGTKQTRSMAIHPHFDFISRSINRKHHWADCDVIPKLWNKMTTKNGDNGKQNIYVEIGANIGACVMEMLLSTDALIVAFEPHPKNRLCLIQTINQLEPELQERVIIVPIALGDEQGTSKIYSASNNMGNSVVGQIVKDYEVQVFDEDKVSEIQIERLDSLFIDNMEDTINIPLLKLDAQGYECRILEGFSQSIGNSVQQILFEYASKWLVAQKCNDLFPKMRQLGFEIYNGQTLITDEEKLVKSELVDLTAIKPTE